MKARTGLISARFLTAKDFQERTGLARRTADDILEELQKHFLSPMHADEYPDKVVPFPTPETVQQPESLDDLLTRVQDTRTPLRPSSEPRKAGGLVQPLSRPAGNPGPPSQWGRYSVTIHKGKSNEHSLQRFLNHASLIFDGYNE